MQTANISSVYYEELTLYFTEAHYCQDQHCVHTNMWLLIVSGCTIYGYMVLVYSWIYTCRLRHWPVIYKYYTGLRFYLWYNNCNVLYWTCHALLKRCGFNYSSVLTYMHRQLIYSFLNNFFRKKELYNYLYYRTLGEAL